MAEFEKRDSATYKGCINAYIVRVETKKLGETPVTTCTIVSSSRKPNTLEVFEDYQIYGKDAEHAAKLQKGDLLTAEGHEEYYRKKDGSTGVRINVQGRPSFSSRLKLSDRTGVPDPDPNNGAEIFEDPFAGVGE